ncbi:50S ribosomal protein L18 [Candidatus Peregrinibacteria bacterium]|nr:50S ribosomal protein L18 [Candidatus Peregrinibacteria bacterium]
MSNKKETLRKRRHVRIRSKIAGTEQRPRLVVFRSLTHTYAQLINDENGVVIAASSDMKATGKANKSDKAKEVGLELAKKAQEKKISEVVFDRNGYKYHGRVKQVAEGAREGGLKF